MYRGINCIFSRSCYAKCQLSPRASHITILMVTASNNCLKVVDFVFMKLLSNEVTILERLHMSKFPYLNIHFSWMNVLLEIVLQIFFRKLFLYLFIGYLLMCRSCCVLFWILGGYAWPSIVFIICLPSQVEVFLTGLLRGALPWVWIFNKVFSRASCTF